MKKRDGEVDFENNTKFFKVGKWPKKLITQVELDLLVR